MGRLQPPLGRVISPIFDAPCALVVPHPNTIGAMTGAAARSPMVLIVEK
jgi:hypothetical protein